MDKEIEENVKSCRGCAIEAKALPVKFTPWSKTDQPWSRLHIDLAGSMKEQYHLIVVDSFSKWPEVMKCKNPMYSSTIRFLHELFTRFDIPDTIVSNNGTQFTAKELKDFCKAFSIVPITTTLYHTRSNGLAERFVDTFKRAIKSDGNEYVEDILQFSRVYHVTPNPNTYKLLPKENKKNNKEKKTDAKSYIPGENIFLKECRNGKKIWKAGVRDKNIGRLMYIIKDQKQTIETSQPGQEKILGEYK